MSLTFTRPAAGLALLAALAAGCAAAAPSTGRPLGDQFDEWLAQRLTA
jgi:hypothetical protein